MAGLFDLPPRSTKAGDSNLSKKVATKAAASATRAGVKLGSGGLIEKIQTIQALVEKNLGKYKELYMVIRDLNELHAYFDAAIINGDIAIDTETSGLDPIACEIAGLCIYTPGQKAAYVPMNHYSYITNTKLDNQLAAEDIKNELRRLIEAHVKVIMFNAKFDIRVIKNQIGIEIPVYWDGYIAARLLNENESENNLKYLHNKYCQNGQGDAFSFESLFKGISFTHIPINVGYLYAARDPEITYELYKFQEPYLTPGSSECLEQDCEGPAYVFHNIEMPLISIVAEMEDVGIALDTEYAAKLSKEYNQRLEGELKNNYEIGSNFGEMLDQYRKKMGAKNKLEYPVNIGSPTQVAIMLYDVLKIPPPDKEKPRSTDEEALSKIDHPIARSILRYRELTKLLSTYIDKLPQSLNPQTGRIHASFNQMGAGTGRFSSSDPNMQNIPSHNEEIRQMFVASPGYVLLSSDYSAQEPRLTAIMSSDPKMIAAYKAGKDLYAEIASLAFDKSYEDCLEKRPDGTTNPEGKQRRSSAKAIVLGVCYGKGIAAIAEDLKITKPKAQEIYDKIMLLFPGLKQFMIDSENMAREKGYVATYWGRKRRLPDINLPPYEFKPIAGKVANSFDPLFDEEDSFDPNYIDENTIDKYTRQLNRARGKEKEIIKQRAREDGILIKDNGGFIAQALRQTVNSRIQGSAADLTKIAMLLVGRDALLKRLGFRLLLQVHDELIAECPEENVRAVAQRFAELMMKAADGLPIPFKCDVEAMYRWYGEKLELK